MDYTTTYHVKRTMAHKGVTATLHVDLRQQHAITRNRVVESLRSGLAYTGWSSIAAQLVTTVTKGNGIRLPGKVDSNRLDLHCEVVPMMPAATRDAIADLAHSFWTAQLLLDEGTYYAEHCKRMVEDVARFRNGRAMRAALQFEPATMGTVRSLITEFHQSTDTWPACAALIDAIKRGEPINALME